MFTGIARMECKALATQLALLRWQMHQRPWAAPLDRAGVVGSGGSPRSSGSLEDSSVGAPRPFGAIPPPWHMQTASQAVSDAGPDAQGSDDRRADALASEALADPRHPRPARKLPARRRQIRSGTVDWEKAAAAPIASQPPLPTLAELDAERVRDQQVRDALKGVILRGYGCAARCSPSTRALTHPCTIGGCTSCELHRSCVQDRDVEICTASSAHAVSLSVCVLHAGEGTDDQR